MEFEKDDDKKPLSAPELKVADVPLGIDRRAFMMRSAVVGAAAVIAGCSTSNEAQTAAVATAASTSIRRLPPWHSPRRK